jgi:acyl carrier protein
MSAVSSTEIRSFIISQLAIPLGENGVAEGEIADDFDLMKKGIIDSIGLINLFGAIEDHFGVEIDFEDMDTETITVIGPVCRYIAERATRRSIDG